MAIPEEITAAELVCELNMQTLAVIRSIARKEDGDALLRIQFGLSAKTSGAIKEMRAPDISKLTEALGGTYLFSSKNTDEMLYQLIRSGLAESDVIMLSKLRSAAAAKQMEA